MPKLTHAFQLCLALRETGTGQGKLDIIRQLIVADPYATAEQAITAMRQQPHRVTQATIDKAIQLMETGEYTPKPEAHIVHPEDRALSFVENQQREQSADKLRKKQLADAVEAQEKLNQANREKAERAAELERKKAELERKKAEEAARKAAAGTVPPVPPVPPTPPRT